MEPAAPIALPPRLHNLAMLAGLMERLERQPLQASAGQYRELALRLDALLAEAAPGAELDALLAASPALAQIYENRQYALAGLCRSPLEAALNAELTTAALLRRAAAKA